MVHGNRVLWDDVDLYHDLRVANALHRTNRLAETRVETPKKVLNITSVR
jgi:hypothetical protein